MLPERFGLLNGRATFGSFRELAPGYKLMPVSAGVVALSAVAPGATLATALRLSA